MTDTDLINRKLNRIEARVRELREMADVEAIEQDVRERRFIIHTLQIAVQAAIDVASHIVSDERLGEPATNSELFDLLARHGYVPNDMVATLRAMTGFRNIVVHGYEEVDHQIVRDIVSNRLDDLVAFSDAIRRKTAG